MLTANSEKLEGLKTTLVEKSRRPEVDFNNLPFGRVFSDHMFMAEFRDGRWGDFSISPYRALEFSPALLALHYGQTIFEGLKAYRNELGEVLMFRPKDNFARLVRSANRMCLAEMPVDIAFEALRKLLLVDSQWVPNTPDASLYIRPFMFASEQFIGVKPSEVTQFIIFTCPVGPYYSTPLKVKIETHYSRAVSGGTGSVKSGGNYGGALYPAKLAQDEGYHQLLWTDAATHSFVEESGTMNVMFVINGTLITPMLNDTILAGITRDSVLTLARDLGYKVEERKVSVDEIVTALKNGKLEDAFGVGTAATIAPIAVIGHQGTAYELPSLESRNVSIHIRTELDHIRYGRKPDPYGWVVKVI